jgi:hypothetical protein
MKVVKRFFGEGSAFSEWSRAQKEFDPSIDKMRVYDIDWVYWKKEDNDYGDGPLMLIEEKCKMAYMTHDQALMYKRLDRSLKLGDKEYFGFHLLQFENTNPNDGLVFIDEKVISKIDFKRFVRYMLPDEFYISWHDKLASDGIHWKQHTATRQQY